MKNDKNQFQNETKDFKQILNRCAHYDIFISI